MSASVKEHHTRKDLCVTRPPYRQGRELKAVKVYTVSQESKYLQIQGVPSVGTEKQLVKLCQRYGSVKSWKKLDKYPCEEFTETYLFHFETIQFARKAKKYLDDRSFFGGVLHIHYVPEYETVNDTREKLQQRRKDVARRINILEKEKKETQTQITASAASREIDSSSAPRLTMELLTQESDAKVPQPSTTTAAVEAHAIDSNSSIGHNPVAGPPGFPPLPPRELPPPPQLIAIPPPQSYFQNPTSSSMYRPHTQPMYSTGFPGHYGVTDFGGYYYPTSNNGPRPPRHPGVGVGANVGPPSTLFNTDRIPQGQSEVNQYSNGRSENSPVQQKPDEQIKCKQWQGKAENVRKNEGVYKNGRRFPESPKAESTTAIKGNKAAEKSSKMVIKEYQPSDKKTGTPKFVPRTNALLKRQILPEKLLTSVKDSVKSVPASEINPIKALRKRKQDPVNNKLRADAFILGDVKGPKLPRKDEELRRDFGESLSGDVAMETNILDIRRKVMEFSVKAQPPQLKKVKKK